MQLDFTKMNGAGNDFVLIDNRSGKISITGDQAVKICDRHRGIGADGVMLLIPSTSGKADWAWDFFNPDGSKAEMCGNGARCFARYIQRVTGTTKSEITFDTIAGMIHASFRGERVTIGLTAPRDLRLGDAVSLKNGCATIHSVNTGVPHACLFVENADAAMVSTVGPEVRYHQHFAPKGTNVNFIQVQGQNQIRVRTYERGVENETLACGTGVTACALVSAKLHGFTSPVAIQVQGGDTLEVSFETAGENFTNVRLTGPADFVFEGKIQV